MKVPSGMTETEVLSKIDSVVNSVARSFVFGYYDIDDIKQEARIFALQALPKYNPELPLENFLCVHIKNRLINLIRDKYHRSDPPCKKCHGSIDGQSEHPDGHYCGKYIAWKNRNSAKAGLVSPLDIGNLDDSEEKNTKLNDDIHGRLEKSEIFDLIDLKLPTNLRADYLKMKAGIPVPKSKKDAVIAAIQKFILPEEINEIYDASE